MTETLGSHTSRITALATLLVVLVGLALYRPWAPVPFDITDFSELLPLLSDTDSFTGAYARVAGYYRSHGRSNLLTSALIAANWALFEADPIGWRILRATVLALSIAAAVWLSLRLRISAMGAAIGASLLVVSQVAATTWLRLTGEPLAFAFFAIAIGLALDYGECERWLRRTLAISLLVLAMGLTKEIMLVCVPFVLAVGLMWRPGAGLGRPILDRRRRVLIAALVSVTLLTGALIGLVAASAASDAYARVYGSARPTAARLIAHLRAVLLPIADPSLVLAPSNVAFLAVVGGGWALALRRTSRRGGKLGALALLLAVPLAGAVVYLPWGRFELFYAFPFLLGPVILLGAAVSELEKVMPRRRWLIWLLCGMILLPPATMAHRITAFVNASRRVNHAIAVLLPELPRTDTLVVAVRGLAAQDWQSRAATFHRFASAIHGNESTRPPPPAMDLVCPDAADLIRTADYGFVLISQGHECGRLPNPTYTFHDGYSYLHPSTLRLRSDTVFGDILVKPR